MVQHCGPKDFDTASVASLLLVAMPGAPSSFLFLVAMPFAPFVAS